MPCDQIQYQRINFETAQGHLDELAQALADCGYQVSRYGETLSFRKVGQSGQYANGKFTVPEGQTFDVDAVKRKFSKHCIKKACKRFGWTMKETGEDQYEVQKGQ